jgi:LysR family hydrogen peroxide-inducible transcriptional activator
LRYRKDIVIIAPITRGYSVSFPTFRQLEYLVALADAGQFVEAARRCGVSQPALSKQVREVEEMLGVTLFERARPNVILTRAGVEVVTRARSLLAQARELAQAAAALTGGRPRTVRLGVIPTIAPYGLPGLLAKLRARYPGVSIVFHELQTEVLLEQLRGGAVDVGLLARPFDTQGLAGPDLIHEPFVLIAPVGHALAVPACIEPREIRGASLILLEDGHCLRDQALDVCAAAGAPPPTSVTAASVATLTRMVESGLGPTLLPASALSAEVRPGQGLVARGFAEPQPGRTLTLQWRASSPYGEWFTALGWVLRDHYLALNEAIPEVAGPRPLLRAVGDP